MILKIIRTSSESFRVRNSNHLRSWMDSTFSKHAYRCAPLVNANQYGWEVILPETVSVTKNQQGVVSITSKTSKSISPICGTTILNESIAFYPNLIFVTEPGYSIRVSGPPNLFIRGAQAYEAIVPTSWWHESFQFSWRIIEPDIEVTFNKNMPIMFVSIIKNNLLSECNVNVADEIGYQEVKEFRTKYLTHNAESKSNKEMWTSAIKGILFGVASYEDKLRDNPQPPKDIKNE